MRANDKFDLQRNLGPIATSGVMRLSARIGFKLGLMVNQFTGTNMSNAVDLTFKFRDGAWVP